MARSIPRNELTIFGQDNKPTLDFNFRAGAVFLIQKPLDWSSFKVIRVLRAILDMKKIGHAGTLDPKATGLLIVCCGKATKSVTQFQELDKEYIMDLEFGASTPSYDSETDKDKTAPWQHITKDDIAQQLNEKFTGTIKQKPPMYSAVHKNGERLYKKARRGEKVDTGLRWVTIHKNEIITFEPPHLRLKVICGKGTYMRSLAHDLALELESRAYVTGLKRTAIGPYKSDNALTMDQIRELK